MGVTHVQNHFVPFFLGPVADPDQFQRFAETIGYPFHHVGDQTAGRTVQCAVVPVIARAVPRSLGFSSTLMLISG